MDLARIRDLLKIVAESGVAELEFEEDGIKLVVRKNAPTVMMQPPPMIAPYGAGYPPQMYPPMPPVYPQVAQAPMPVAGIPPVNAAQAAILEEPEHDHAPPADEGVVVRAPIVGTFYEASAPDADPFVKIGDTVQVGEVLCIIEAMKLMNDIESEVAGTVRKILAQNAEPVEYDQPLFLIEPA